MLPRNVNTEVAVLCRSVYDRGIPFEEAEVELAYIAVQEKYGFNELRPVRVPTMPDAVREFNRLNRTERYKFLIACQTFFTENGDGGRYYNGIRVARDLTRRNLDWLNVMKVIFEKAGDVQLTQKVQNRIYEFDDVQEPETVAAGPAENQKPERTWVD